MIIAFSGNDGSGKTSVLNDIKKKYKKSLIIIPESFYFFRRIIYKKEFDLKEKPELSKEDYLDSKTISWLIPYFMFFDYLFHIFYLRIKYKDKTIIFDRYTYDLLATYEEKKISNFIIRFLYLNLLKPDLIFYFSAKPETSYKRVEHIRNLKFYVLKKKIYDEIFNDLKTCIILNGKKEVPHLSNQIINFINIKLKLCKTKEISISGIDGSGKTTAINGFKKELNKLNIKYHVAHIYYDYIPIKLYRFFFKEKNKETEEYFKKSLKNEENAIKKSKSKLWARMVLIDSLIQYYTTKTMYKKKLIIFDRTFFDYEISFNFLGVGIDRFIKKLPKPTRGFVFVANPEILYKRKPEHTINFFKKCVEDYKELSKKYRYDIIDTSKLTEKEVVDRLIRAITK